MHPKPSVNESCRSCANAGVLGPVAGMIGCLQAIEAIKLLQSDLLRRKQAPELRDTHSKTDGKDRNQVFHSRTLHDRQTFYDGGSGTFYNFNLTSRNPKCLICSEDEAVTVIRSMDDSKRVTSEALLENASIASAYKVSLPPEHTIEASRYADERINNAHIVIDVRNITQFEMSSFQNYFPDTDTLPNPSAIPTSDILPSRSYLVHIPLDVLTGGKNDRSKEENRNIILNHLRNLLFKHPTTVAEGGDLPRHRDVFVICRRGIDSTVATHYLLSSGFGPNVYNIEGGYTAWKATVDHSFPLY